MEEKKLTLYKEDFSELAWKEVLIALDMEDVDNKVYSIDLEVKIIGSN